MLSEELVLFPQQCEGNYDFDLPIKTSAVFDNVFGELAAEIVSKAVALIIKTYPNAHYLQVFNYGNQKIWCFSANQNNDIEKGCISFLLPEEY